MANWYDNVPTPVDANGREVPLETKDLAYKGETRDVLAIAYNVALGLWVASIAGMVEQVCLSACTLPDSWERLEGDVRRSLGPMAACSYFGRGMGDGCRGCPSGARGSDCNRAMSGDILRRSEALAGVARQTCRLVPYGDGTGQGTCSECHGALTDKDNFCPDCGREIEVTDD